MLRLLYATLRARHRLAAWGRVRCVVCGLRRGEADLTVCEGPTLTVMRLHAHHDPHTWADQLAPRGLGGRRPQPTLPDPRHPGSP